MGKNRRFRLVARLMDKFARDQDLCGGDLRVTTAQNDLLIFMLVSAAEGAFSNCWPAWPDVLCGVGLVFGIFVWCVRSKPCLLAVWSS